MTENKLNEGTVECVDMGMSDTDAYFYANKAAKELGSADACGFKVVFRCEGGDWRRVWVSYSNGIWCDTVDCRCMDSYMQDKFVDFVKQYAKEADLMSGRRF